MYWLKAYWWHVKIRILRLLVKLGARIDLRYQNKVVIVDTKNLNYLPTSYNATHSVNVTTNDAYFVCRMPVRFVPDATCGRRVTFDVYLAEPVAFLRVDYKVFPDDKTAWPIPNDMKDPLAAPLVVNQPHGVGIYRLNLFPNGKLNMEDLNVG